MDKRHKISYYNIAPPAIYQEILNTIDSQFDDVAFRWSYNHVPHLLIERNDVLYSLCYFKKSKTWRLFYPYQGQQTKIDFESWPIAIAYIKEAPCKVK